MIIFKNVQSYNKPKLKELIYNTLYIRSNIRQYVEQEGEEAKESYIYDEFQYEGNEILEYLDSKQIESERLVTDLELNQLQTDQALTEIELKILDLEGVK